MVDRGVDGELAVGIGVYRAEKLAVAEAAFSLSIDSRMPSAIS